MITVMTFIILIKPSYHLLKRMFGIKEVLTNLMQWNFLVSNVPAEKYEEGTYNNNPKTGCWRRWCDSEFDKNDDKETNVADYEDGSEVDDAAEDEAYLMIIKMANQSIVME